MLKIYHNPRCKISRQGLDILQKKNVQVEIVEYLKTPFTPASLKKLLNKLNMRAEDLVRKNEELYKKELKGKSFNEEEWIKILISHPALIERPIVEKEYKAIVGRPAETILDILK